MCHLTAICSARVHPRLPPFPLHTLLNLALWFRWLAPTLQPPQREGGRARLCFSNQGTLPATFFLIFIRCAKIWRGRYSVTGGWARAKGERGAKGQFRSLKLTNANCSGAPLNPLLVSYEDLRYPSILGVGGWVTDCFTQDWLAPVGKKIVKNIFGKINNWQDIYFSFFVKKKYKKKKRPSLKLCFQAFMESCGFISFRGKDPEASWLTRQLQFVWKNDSQQHAFDQNVTLVSSRILVRSRDEHGGFVYSQKRNLLCLRELAWIIIPSRRTQRMFCIKKRRRKCRRFEAIWTAELPKYYNDTK